MFVVSGAFHTHMRACGHINVCMVDQRVLHCTTMETKIIIIIAGLAVRQSRDFDRFG